MSRGRVGGAGEPGLVFGWKAMRGGGAGGVWFGREGLRGMCVWGLAWGEGMRGVWGGQGGCRSGGSLLRGVSCKGMRRIKEGRLVWGRGRGVCWERKGRKDVKGQPDPGLRGQKSEKGCFGGSQVLGRRGMVVGAACFEGWRA